MRHLHRLVLSIASVSILAWASESHAQRTSTSSEPGSLEAEQAEAQEGDDAEGASSTPAASTEVNDEQALLQEEVPVEDGHSSIDPHEESGETYLFLGAFARALVVPAFIQNLFVDTTATPVDAGVGLYFNYRRDGFNVQVEAFWQSLYNEGFYRDPNDPATEQEWVRSELHAVMGSVGFGWAIDIVDWFAIEIGFGLGLGGIVGRLQRQEAYWDDGWQRCVGPGDPGQSVTGSDQYCESTIEAPNPENGRLDDGRVRGGTYQYRLGTENPIYFGGGGVPPMFFTIDLPRVSFRFKPIRQIQIRIDMAYNLYGFSFGGSAGYGF